MKFAWFDSGRARSLGWLCALLLSCLPHAGQAAAQPTAACPPPLPAAPAAKAKAPDRGLLWRVTRDGHSSWLFGTLHVGKPAWRAFGPRVSEALKSSDMLALEIDPGDPAVVEALTEPKAPAPLSDAMQARLRMAYERACIPPSVLAAWHPLLQATTLTILEARWLGLDPEFSMEMLLMERMRALRRKVDSLETPEQQRAALLPTDPAEAQAALDEALKQLEDSSSRRTLGLMAAAWERGDLENLENYESWCNCAPREEDRAVMRRLNDERNPALADGIEARHRKGLRVFAAVGALHMTGAQSLPRLLAAKGFKVERIAFSP
jgi:uncharacterized protein YbaP (TraB family)